MRRRKFVRTAHRHPRNSTELRHFVGAFALVAFWLFASTFARAHNFCPTNSAELQDALNQSSDDGIYSGQDNDIRLIQHTYKTGAATANGAFVYHSSSATGSL